MAIEARIRSSFTWRFIIMSVVFLVLGVWGVYDYAVSIPTKERRNAQRVLIEQARAALETPQPDAKAPTAESVAALVAVRQEFWTVAGRLAAQEIERRNAETTEEMREALQEIHASEQDLQWMSGLVVIADGLVGERTLPLQGKPRQAYEQTEQFLTAIGHVDAPSAYDRPVQWLYILCLPCVPYFVWVWWVARRKVYRLDDDGTLHLPEGDWPAADITDIDMRRWMAKSIATVEHRSGTRAELDDYKYRDLHLIVGSIAHRLHPDEWDAEAKPATKATDAGDGEGSGEEAEVTGAAS